MAKAGTLTLLCPTCRPVCVWSLLVCPEIAACNMAERPLPTGKLDCLAGTEVCTPPRVGTYNKQDTRITHNGF